MAWFKKEKKPKKPIEKKRIQMPEGLWVKCNFCKEIIYKKEVLRNANICPKCNYHFRIDAMARIAMLLDDNEYEEFDAGMQPEDPLNFKDTLRYTERLAKHQEWSGRPDALISTRGDLGGIPVVLCVMEYGFMGGSMGSVVGEKVTRAIEGALETERPLVIVSASGGARMQEGALSLMQMAKICGALAKLDEAGLPYLSVLTDPTTGGVTASYAMLGDLNIAEPRALIGFAGPRVIKQTINRDLPDGFQRAEFLLERGMLDLIVERRNLKDVLARALHLLLKGNSFLTG